MCSTSLPTAASRASVSRLPSPASTSSRVFSVSSNVMFPELPDAKIEIRKPIAAPSGLVQRFDARSSASRQVAHSTELPASSQSRQLRSTKKQRKCGNRHASANSLVDHWI